MSIWQGFILGLVQGLTEFLPVSSSGHLVLFQHFFPLGEAALTFDVLLHLSTLIAIIVFFGRSLFKVTLREWVLVVVGTVPAALIGVAFKDQIEAWFAADALVGWELVITGMITLWMDRALERQAKLGTEAHLKKEIGWREAVLMGIGQAIAIIPGISRSGTTVAAGVWQKVDRETAFRFSFLLAIPALAGAGVLQLKDSTAADWAALPLLPVAIGCITALIAALLSLFVFHWVIKKARLEWFGWYCIAIGVVAIIWLR